MDTDSLRFAQVVRVALIMTTAPLSCWSALRDPDAVESGAVIGLGETIAALIGKVIDRTWPDPAAKAMAALEIQKLVQAGEFKAIDAELERARQQTAVNQVEAANPDRFVSGWRPAVGWVCASALAWHYIGRPVATWVLLISGGTTPIPAVELGDLLVILVGMLGLSGMRSYDKAKGTALH